MAGETELERLVVRLVGDATNYIRMLTDSLAQTQQVVKEVEAAVKKVESFGKEVQGFASSVLGALGSFGIASSLQGAFNKFAEMETGQIRLRATIEGSGRAVEETIDQYLGFARTIEATTLLTKGQTLGMIQQAEALGMQGEAARRVTQNAIGMAGALDGEASSYIRVAVAMEHGNASMLQRMLHLRHGTSESEIFAEAQRIIDRGLRIQEAQMNSSSGQIQKLQRSFADITKEIGGLIARAINPLISGLMATINWFKSLDPTVRSVTLGVIALLLVLQAYPTVVSVLSAVLGNLAVVMRIVRVASTLMFGPWGLVILAVIALVVLLINQFGGIEAAWQELQKGAAEFWEQVRPILLAVGGLLSALGDALQGVFKAIAGSGIDAFGLILLSFEATFAIMTGGLGPLIVQWLGGWGAIKDMAVNAFIAAEFGVRNFGAYAEMVWTAMQLAWVRFTGLFSHFFDTVLPAYIAWLQQNWLNLFTDMFNLSVTIIGNLVSNVVNLIISIPDLISGQTRWEDVWRPLTEGFQASVGQLPEIAAREIGDVERQLQQEFDQQRDALDQSFDAFRRRRLAEMNAQTRQAERDGSDIGKNLNKGLGKELGKFDAALSGSAEALTRIASFQNDAQVRAEGGGRSPPGGPRNRPQPPRSPGGGGGFNLGNVLSELGSRLWTMITGAAQQAWTAIQRFFIDGWNSIVRLATDFWNNLPDNVLEALDWIGDSIGDLIDGAAEAIFQFWDDLPENIEWIWNEAVRFASDTWDSITGWAMDFWNNLPANIAAIWTAIQNAGIAVWDAITRVATAVWNTIAGLASGAWDRIVTIARAVWDRIVEFFQQAVSRITGAPAEALRNVSSGIRERTGIDLEGAVDGLRDAAGNLAEFGQGAIATINPANWLG